MNVEGSSYAESVIFILQLKCFMYTYGPMLLHGWSQLCPGHNCVL